MNITGTNFSAFPCSVYTRFLPCDFNQYLNPADRSMLSRPLDLPFLFKKRLELKMLQNKLFKCNNFDLQTSV